MASKTLICYVHVAHPETGEIKAFGPEDTVPAWAVKAITNPDVWADDNPDSGDDGGDDVSPYKGKTKAELKAEIDARNADRDDDAKIQPASDKNGDLVAALDADDAAQA